MQSIIARSTPNECVGLLSLQLPASGSTELLEMLGARRMPISPRRKRTQVLALLATAGAPLAASARQSMATDAPRLDWRAPAGCPERDDVLSQVAVLASEDGVRWARFE